jgi:predicted ATPase
VGSSSRDAGVAEWPDGTVAGRYVFIHALYQKVLYARVPIGHRVGLHLRIGARLERAHGARAGEIAGELAMHFEHGRDFERAFAYRRQAAQAAFRHHGYQEAADHARRALALLDAFPESPARFERELVAHVQLGTALTAMEGWTAPEAARTFAHVHALCMRLGPIPQTFPVLFALSRFYVSRGELPRVREVAEHLSRLADTTGDTATRLGAYNVSGVALFYGGDFAPALDSLERGMAVYDPERHGATRSSVRTGDEVGVSCWLHAAWALWMLGYPDRAATRMRQALDRARTIDSPFTRVFACHLAAALHHCRGERDVVRQLEDEATRLATEHVFGLFSDVDAIYRGWLDAEEQGSEDTIARMRDALAGYRAKGAELQRPTFLGVLADVCQRLGRPEEGLAVLAEELAPAHGRSLCYWDADLHRWKGEFELACGAERDAEASFREAREIARRQQARSFELRAVVSLSRLWRRQGRTAEALALLSDTYRGFTEGFDTRDLGEARTLLDELSARDRSR